MKIANSLFLQQMWSRRTVRAATGAQESTLFARAVLQRRVQVAERLIHGLLRGQETRGGETAFQLNHFGGCMRSLFRNAAIAAVLSLSVSTFALAASHT